MPQTKNANLRYRAIEQCIKRNKHMPPTLYDLMEACSKVLSVNGKVVSVGKTTIQHDIQDMREGRAVTNKKAPIQYDPVAKGYIYTDHNFSLDELQLDEDEWHALRYAATLLYQYKEVPLFSHFKTAIERIDSAFQLGLDPEDKSIDRIVLFETPNSTSGYQWIYEIFYAIKRSFPIEFKYENIYKKEKRKYRALPYLLREYRNRWYMVVWSEEKECFVTFPLDRIIELKAIQEKQKRRDDFDAAKFFSDSVGIFAVKGSPKKTKLTVFPPYDRLLELEPLHSSQTLQKNKNGSVSIEVKVNITPEFVNRILSFGPYCKVEQPAELVATIRDAVNSMKKLYSK